jgi:hypothetical protein
MALCDGSLRSSNTSAIAGGHQLVARSKEDCLGRDARACSVSVETDHALDSLFGRIFYGKPVSTFPENALADRRRPFHRFPASRGRMRDRSPPG